jgi:hypothetical protein
MCPGGHCALFRVLRQVADPVGRSRGPGRPWLWRLKTPGAVGLPRRQTEIIEEMATWPILPILQTMSRRAVCNRFCGSVSVWAEVSSCFFGGPHDPT